MVLILAAAMSLQTRPLPNRLVLEVIAPASPHETIVFDNDHKLFERILASRGIGENEIIYKSLSSFEDLSEVLSAARKRIASWKSGTLIFYYSGHGAALGSEPPFRAGLHIPPLAPEHVFPWHRVFTELSAPKGVQILLLPDC